jgi:hypothetical protein
METNVNNTTELRRDAKLLVSRSFTIEDMKEAFIYGRKSEFSYQCKLESTPYISFEQWLQEKYG